MRPTDEQAAIIASEAQRLRVLALAGTGKTSTLKMFAEANPGARILYLAFNRWVADEVRRAFPRHVTAKTTHSVALRSFGQRYRGQIGELRIWELAERLHSPYTNPPVRTRFARYARETLHNWFASPDPHISAQHLPGVLKRDPGERMALDRPIDRERVLQVAWRLWDEMRDPTNESVPIPHDGYLKQWSLNQPTLPYDIVLLDEAQDTNAPVLEVLKHQPGRLVFVGDPMQAIYAWRGAVNAMAMPSDETLYLTGSFRFGPEIAEVGDAVLQWVSPRAPQLRGLAQPGYVGKLLKGHQLAVLGRTNEGLFDMAASLVTQRPDARVGWIGGISAYGFDVIEQVYRLWSPKLEPDDPDIARFQDFDALKDYADHAGDVRLKIRAKVVDKYGDRTPEILATLRAADYGDRAPNVFSTVHRAKGGEWPQVVMAADFAEMMDDGAPVDLKAKARNSKNPEAVMEDGRLRYVAATRAQRCLRPDGDCMAYLRWLRQRSRGQATANAATG